MMLPQGIKGIKGEQGVKGFAGSVGAAGTNGINTIGATGRTGATGPIGVYVTIHGVSLVLLTDCRSIYSYQWSKPIAPPTASLTLSRSPSTTGFIHYSIYLLSPAV